jgi:hypothetical protein
MARTPGAIVGLVLAGLALVALPRAHAEPSGAVCADGERSLWFDVSAWGPEPAWRLTTYRRALKKPD